MYTRAYGILFSYLSSPTPDLYLSPQGADPSPFL
jgi:hypothetical protein